MLICLTIFGCRIRIGQRHGAQFRRLALEKLAQPGQGDTFPLLRGCRITAVAPTSTLRNPSSPARVITPSLTLPAVE